MDALLEPLELNSRLAHIAMYQSRINAYYNELQQLTGVSPVVKRAYQTIIADYLWKLQREIHSLWLCMCEKMPSIEQAIEYRMEQLPPQ